MVGLQKLPKSERSVFLEGPVNSGKTTAVINYLTEKLLEDKSDPRSVLVFVPHSAQGKPYHEAFPDLTPTVVTPGVFARQMVRRFWAHLAEVLALDPATGPVFLNYETAQYFMRRFAQPLIQAGVFDSLSLSNNRLIAQLVDHLDKVVLGGLTLEEAEQRLKHARGPELGTSREAVYHAASQITRNYHDFCYQHGLLDYAAQMDLFNHHLLRSPAFETYFRDSFFCLVADNIEEMGALNHEFIEWGLKRVRNAVLIYESDGGYRVFLGADPVNAHRLAESCDVQLQSTVAPLTLSTNMQQLLRRVQHFFDDKSEDDPDYTQYHAENTALFDQCLQVLRAPYYPDMLAQCGTTIADLVKSKKVPPSQIAVIAPYITDTLQFSLTRILRDLDIRCQVLRPSRPVIAAPAVRVLLPLIGIVYPEYAPAPSPQTVATAFSVIIDGLDAIRSQLLVQIVYHHNLSGWSEIKTTMRDRITEDIGQRYERLRLWLADAAAEQQPLDRFLAGLFEDILAQPGYGFFDNPDASHAVESLIQSIQRFRETAYLIDVERKHDPNRELFALLTEGLISARYESEFESRDTDAILIMPAHTYLTQNSMVDYQFWLDIGHSGWSERLEQPLTHPYVLRHGYSPDRVWTDDDEQLAEEELLRNITLGLLRRCRKGIFVNFCDLNEMGYEQYGPLVKVFEALLMSEGENQ